MRFSEKKNEKIRQKNDQIIKRIDSIKLKATIKKSNNVDFFINDEFAVDNTKIGDPCIYFKRLNTIINRVKFS